MCASARRMALLATATLLGSFVAAPPQATARSTQEYVVTYASGTTSAMSAQRLGAEGIRPTARFTRAVNGFVADLTDEQRAALAADPRVERIEPNTPLRASGTQVDPPWGLDRLDQGTSTFTLDNAYSYDASAQGASVNVYVIDSGVRATHTDLASRVRTGRNFVPHGDPGESVPNADTSDCHGHGTHVAGTVAGTRSGVAKQSTIVPVRMLDCDGDGDVASAVAAIDWAIADAQASANASRRAVANLSFGGTYSATLNAAVTRMTQANIAVAVAAGNGGAPVSGYSPASEATSVTVGAVGTRDDATSWSNHGTGLDVWAPGTSVVSAGRSGDTSYATKSGTSMAAPHVAGVMAVLRSAHPDDTAYEDAHHTSVRERLASLYRPAVTRRSGDTASPVSLVQSPTPGRAVCTTSIGFVADANGVLHTLTDPAVLTGTGTLRARSAVGSGWTTRAYSWYGHGGDGVVYLVSHDGRLRWYRYVDGRWAPGSGRVIGTGWYLGRTFTDLEVGADGTFYAVTRDGRLRLYRHRGHLSGTARWSSWTIGTGWRAPQVLAPGGEGVLYRQYAGRLYWYRHTDPAVGRVRWQGGRVVGTGWRFADLVPVGGGLLYAVNGRGDVRSYRNTGYLTGRPTWDSIRAKSRVARTLGMVLDPTTCGG